MIDNTHTLTVERTLNAPRDKIWRCWTDPDLLKQWYVPKPWYIPTVDLDVRPGGRCNFTMAGPDGERIENVGCYLEVTSQERLVFTDGYSEDFMPRPDGFMTGVVKLSDAGKGQTKMLWSARHATPELKQKHLDMGFEQGWNACVDQLAALCETQTKTGTI
ncbi:SRPBCC family protein [Robiginitomaculum antarcticum]|uniref:SRPBCC family protein n=1 Tax=Robiginitomaculum antarcticum TaxID=437507 RepID=UPI000381E870|nr:SRPBCC family protein [Robiginitomaculum antarcticum]